MAESRAQLKLIRDSETWHEAIAAKISTLGVFDDSKVFNQVRNFDKCGKDPVTITCTSCGEQHVFNYRCSIKWCPKCNWRLAEERRRKIFAWACHIKQPKHIVTTQKNFDIITTAQIKRHTHNLQLLRDSKVFSGVRGGCVSVECTGKFGWHLHAHWLVDADWVDAGQLAITWGKIVGQEFAIVKVQDKRGEEFLREISKYVVKGNDLASWEPEKILEFILAVYRARFFFTFGSLRALKDEVKNFIEAGKREKFKCECGSGNFKFGAH